MSYTKQGFVNNDENKPLTAEQLIAMEDGIIECQEAINNVNKSTSSYSLAGKVISVLGDSISSYQGYIPVADGFNEAHPHAYPSGDVNAWNKTWWGQVISRLGAKLGINDSWSGSRVHNSSTATNPGGNVGTKVCMASVTRTSNLGSNGTPDVILVYGGTNDGKFSPYGTFDHTKAYTDVDLETNTWSTFEDAYVTMIMRLQHYYPKAKIVALLPTFVTSWYTNDKLSKMDYNIQQILEYFGVICVDVRKCITNANKTIYLKDGLHPNYAGMTLIADYVIAQMSKSVILDSTENVVYTVTNNLTNVTTDKPHIKGVSKGTTYTATLTGDGLSSVTVTVGGVDKTSSVLNNGVITISNVTGNIVING